MLGLALACGGDSGGGDETGDATAGDASPAAVPEDPYGPCGDPSAAVPCDTHATAVCEQRTDDASGTDYAVCAVPCNVDADCPALAAGNIPPSCAVPSVGDPRCRIVCNLAANSCPSGMVCLDGDPPECMWALGGGPGHASAEEFCATACEECGATLLLPWTTDCAAACAADLADCSAEDQQTAFACTGGPTCPAGGPTVATCLAGVSCVDGG
jgi:hypothetical protein